MTGWRCAAAVLLLAGCARGSGAPAAAVAPTQPPAATPATPPAPPPPPPVATPERPPSPSVIRYGPSAMRYVVDRKLHVEQLIGGQQHPQDLGARLFVGVVITGPADANGYPTTITVDSVLSDSGTLQPIAGNMARVRALILAGRLAPRGDFQATTTSDSVSAQNIAQLAGTFRDFLPRVPVEGVSVGATWTDTSAVTQRASGGSVTRRTTTHSTAGAWEVHAGIRSVRIESTATYSLVGSTENGGQVFQFDGTGTTTARAFIAEDGRYLGGESRDSTSLTVSLPAQGLKIPRTQVLQSSVSVRP